MCSLLWLAIEIGRFGPRAELGTWTWGGLGLIRTVLVAPSPHHRTLYTVTMAPRDRSRTTHSDSSYILTRRASLTQSANVEQSRNSTSMDYNHPVSEVSRDTQV